MERLQKILGILLVKRRTQTPRVQGRGLRFSAQENGREQVGKVGGRTEKKAAKLSTEDCKPNGEFYIFPTLL